MICNLSATGKMEESWHRQENFVIQVALRVRWQSKILCGGQDMTILVGELLKQAETLSANEQLTLAGMLIERARRATSPLPTGRKWMDIAGIAPYPLAGEDAQDWVSRTRAESGEREQQWRPVA